MKTASIATDAFDDVAQARAARGESLVYVAMDDQVVGLITVADQPKANAKEAVRLLKDLGLNVAMISGDAKASASAVAGELGIDTVFAEASPEEKLTAIKTLAETGPVTFVGDGINDAPALAAAEAGIAIGTGTDIAIDAADVVLMQGDPMGVARAVAVSTETMRNIRQNLAWAFGYNIVLIPVAAGALYPVFGLLLSPMLAAAAMALSSVAVVTNALRLKAIGRGEA